MGNSCCTKKVKNPIQKPDIPIENKKSENSSQFKKDGKESYRRSIKNRVGVIEKGSKVSDETSETRFASISELKVTQRDERLIKQALVKNFVFTHIQQESVQYLIKEMQHFVIDQGRELFKQNDVANYFFILINGSLEVLVDGKRKNIIHPGTGFGELALIHNTRRTATIRALQRCTLWGLGRQTFRAAIELLNRNNYNENMSFINSVPLLQVLTQQQKDLLVSSLVSHNYSNGQIIINEGDPGDLFYLIQEGVVSCTLKGEELRTMAKGEFFGEQALLYNTVRTATVKAVSPVKLLSISRDTLTQALGDHLQSVLYRNTVKISFENSQYLRKLNKEQIDGLINIMCEQVHSFKNGEAVLQPGHNLKDTLFVLLKGELAGSQIFKVFQCPFEDKFIKNQDVAVKEQFFARGDTDIAQLNRSQFMQVLQGSYQEVAANNAALKIVKQVPLFKNLPALRLDELIQQLQIIRFQDGQTIVQQGSTGDEFFIVKRGSVNVYLNNQLLRAINKNDYFGERALLFNEQRTASVIAQGEVSCWVLKKENFLQLLDQDKYNLLMKRIGFQDDRVELDDLVIVDNLGKGQFGHVFLSAHKTKNLLYALKTVTKQKVEMYDIAENLLLERRIMLQLDHPFIVKLVKTFKDDQRVYFLMEFIQGLDLFEVLRKLGIVNEEHSKFYVTCIILMLEHLHERNIVFRDLKPENIMVDEDGYLRLIDFGVSKIISDRTYTTTGTPHYMAPEIIQNKGYTTSIDYWSLGIMLYEFIAGDVPFGPNDEDPIDIYKSVLYGKLSYPGYVSKNNKAIPFIEQLLNKNPALRGNAQTLKKHDWLEGFDWDGLLSKRLQPPYKQRPLRLDSKVMDAKRKNYNLRNIIRNEEMADPVENGGAGRRRAPEDWDREF